MDLRVLERVEWTAVAEAHRARLAPYVDAHLARRRTGAKHPVHDFLFGYYSHRPAELMRWHPGFGTVLLDAPEYGGVKGYIEPAAGIAPHGRTVEAASERSERRGLSRTVGSELVEERRGLVKQVRALLVATEGRPATLGCFGLHEWAMVHRAAEHGTRHDWPLRLGSDGTDRVVEGHRIACSHFDAFRFFTPSSRPLNTLSPGRDDRPSFEQPGCLHAGMDLYKHAFRLSPLVPSDLVADCFDLARDIPVLDMRASPYDLADLGFDPVRIETADGKAEYAEAQRAFAERGAPLRRRTIEQCDRLLVLEPA